MVVPATFSPKGCYTFFMIITAVVAFILLYTFLMSEVGSRSWRSRADVTRENQKQFGLSVTLHEHQENTDYFRLEINPFQDKCAWVLHYPERPSLKDVYEAPAGFEFKEYIGFNESGKASVLIRKSALERAYVLLDHSEPTFDGSHFYFIDLSTYLN